MSDYEQHFGKLRLVPQEEGQTMDELCKSLWVKEGQSADDYEEPSTLFDEYYEKYIMVDGKLWEVFDHTESDDDTDFHIADNKDGTYTFQTRFYNGGTCLSEMLEDAIKKL